MSIGIYHRTTEHKKNISEALTGRHLSLECRKKLSEIQKTKKGDKSPHYGKHHSGETRKKLSEIGKAKLGDKSPNWKGGQVKVGCRICGKGKYAYPSRIRDGRIQCCSRKCVGIYIAGHMKTKDTSIEIAIEKELFNRKILYTKQVPVLGIALVDFLLSNKIIIQCDGDYWHSLEKNKNRTDKQDLALTSNGYRVFRFSETEIKKSSQECINKIFGGFSG